MNAILGTEVNVRILRVLAGTSVPMAPTEVATQAMVNRSGASRALAGLEELGVVEHIGVGRRQPVALRRSHPLAPALAALFEAEQNRFAKILEQLKLVVAGLTPAPKSVWMEGRVAAHQDRIGDVLRIGLLTGSKDVARSVARVESDTLPVQRKLDVTIEVRGLTEPDLVTLNAEEASKLDLVVPVFGPPPASFLGGLRRTPLRRSHREIDDDARALAAAIAAQLKRDPSILERAKKFVHERTPRASAAEQRELRQWETVLNTMTPPRLRQFLVDPGERATRLRQTLPFLAVLTPDEQADVYVRSARARRKVK